MLVDPIAEYHESVGIATIGGFVSRISSTNNLWGKYVFGDFQSPLTSPTGNGLLLYFDTNQVKNPNDPYTIYRLAISPTGAAMPAADLLGMGEGANGAIYAMFDNGQIFELIPMSIPLPGDYDNNRVVDAADYVVWRDNVGTSNILLNDAIGGEIGPLHFDQWRANFGRTIAASAAGTTAVPEPTCQVLLIALAMAGMPFRLTILRQAAPFVH
jgi:hypothetical protein